MNVDGHAIADVLQQDIKKTFSEHDHKYVLRVFVLQSDVATAQFIDIKKRIGVQVGVDVLVEQVDSGITTSQLCSRIDGARKDSDGIIVQLPLPKTINEQKILDSIPLSHDVDCLGTQARDLFERGGKTILPPVVGAMKEILERSNISVSDKHTVVVGEGRLVGKPASVWFTQQGSLVDVANRETQDLTELTLHADILVLGAGSPGMIRPDMIKDGVVILDAGTSELGGRIVGDADPACSKKSALFTPTPGGIGPIAVTMIFANLLMLHTGRF